MGENKMENYKGRSKPFKVARKAKDKQERVDVMNMWVEGSMFGKWGGTITLYVLALPHMLQKQLDENSASDMAHMKLFYDDQLSAHRVSLGLPPI